MVFLLLLSLIFYQDVYGSFFYDKIKTISSRDGDYTPVSSYVGLSKKGLILHDPKNVNIQSMNPCEINSALESFRTVKKNLQAKLPTLSKVFFEPIRLSIQPEIQKKSFLEVANETVESTITFANDNESENGVVNLFHSDNNSSGDLAELVAANISCIVEVGKSVEIPIFGQAAKDFIFGSVLRRIIPGVPLCFTVDRGQVPTQLNFSDENFISVARVMVANDEQQTLNMFTFISALIFFNGQSSSPFFGVVSPGDFFSKISQLLSKDKALDQDKIKDLDEEADSHLDQESNNDKDMKQKIDFITQEIEGLHEKCLKKGLASEVIIANVFSIVAGNPYQKKIGMEALLQLFKDSRAQIEGAVDKKIVVEDKNKGVFFKQKENLFKAMGRSILNYTKNMVLYLSVPAALFYFIKKGVPFFSSIVNR
jgi:hypothetical protein